jgi:hypothetical protein
LRSSLEVNDSLYSRDILSAYSLGRIHNNIYRINESIIFLVVFPTPLSEAYRLYKPIVLPVKNKLSKWTKLVYNEDTRLIIHENKSRRISISDWTERDGLVVLEYSALEKPNVTGIVREIPAPKNNHLALQTTFGRWTVCNNEVTLHSWNSHYSCSNIKYQVPNGLARSHIRRELNLNPLLKQSSYSRTNNNTFTRELIKTQESEIINRSVILDAYVEKLQKLIEATKEGSNIISDIGSVLSRLLPTEWIKTIKTIFIFVGIVILIPIVVFVLILLLNVSE